MARAYLLLLVVAAGLAAMIGNWLPAPSRAHDTLVVSNGAAGSDSVSGTDEDVPQLMAADGAVRLERSANGHFYADVEINGASVRALVDTGATGIALSRDDARNAGLAISIGMPNVIGRGADGDVRGEFVTLDTISLGGKTVEGMGAMVLNSGEQSLLGQEFLRNFESVEIRGDRMELR